MFDILIIFHMDQYCFCRLKVGNERKIIFLFRSGLCGGVYHSCSSFWLQDKLRPLTKLLIDSLVVIVSEIRHHSFTLCYITAAVKWHIKHSCLSHLNTVVLVGTEIEKNVIREVCDTLLSSLVGLRSKRKVKCPLAPAVTFVVFAAFAWRQIINHDPARETSSCLHSSSSDTGMWFWVVNLDQGPIGGHLWLM